MPKSSKTLHNELLKKLKALDNTRKNFEIAFNASTIQIDDISQAYAGLYLDLFTEFENLIEKLFMGLLNGDIRPNNLLVTKKVIIKPSTEIETVLLGEKKNYLDWLPYPDNTIVRAKIYFRDGKPFTFISAIQKDKISNYHKIRNAIAHKSKKAMKEFDAIISTSTLLPHEKTPQGYLRNIPNRATGKTQLEIISDELEAISFTLCN
ncbi:MAG TPA: hypothetical protein DCR40_00585 [Prolixibacteraceae bacterium]|nr:hypothetical protein [Prolixibacteraceae bacterium]